jgi:hypothetical protein
VKIKALPAGKEFIGMKLSGSALFWIFLWSIFMGITAISIGFGAMFPSMNRIARPFICPRGEMELTTQDYQVSPTESGTILNWYCVDQETGERTELGIFPMSLYAGVIYGLLLFAAIVVGWSLYQRWNAAPKSAEMQMWAGRIQNGLIILFVAGMILFGLRPLFNSTVSPSEPTLSPAEVTATSVAVTLHEMSSGTPIAFTSTEKPLTNWKGIPIMSQAVAGQGDDSNRYSFKVPVDSGTIESFYKDNLKSLGWEIKDRQWLGMNFTKGDHTLLVTYAPNSDLQSWVVTLVLVQ